MMNFTVYEQEEENSEVPSNNCEMCGNSFSTKKGLFRHLRTTHGDLTPRKTCSALDDVTKLECSSCGAHLSTKLDFYRHVHEQHGVAPRNASPYLDLEMNGRFGGFCAACKEYYETAKSLETHWQCMHLYVKNFEEYDVILPEWEGQILSAKTMGPAAPDDKKKWCCIKMTYNVADTTQSRKDWIEQYTKLNGTVWRVLQCNKLRDQLRTALYRCEHRPFIHKKGNNLRKPTDCPASVYMKFGQNTLGEKFMRVTLRSAHNHDKDAKPVEVKLECDSSGPLIPEKVMTLGDNTVYTSCDDEAFEMFDCSEDSPEQSCIDKTTKDKALLLFCNVMLKAESSPEVARGVTEFVKTLENIRSDIHLAVALRTFGKH